MQYYVGLYLITLKLHIIKQLDIFKKSIQMYSIHTALRSFEMNIQKQPWISSGCLF